jgi:cell division GTPase FtsZ
MVTTVNLERDNTAFLGLGQCGGNIAEIAEQYGYATAAINTSSDDLNSLDVVRNKMEVNNGDGCGKDRSEAISAVKKNYNKIIKFVQDKLVNNNKTTIFVAFSTGGGTGSGFAPILIDLLSKKFPEVSFKALAFTPTNIEGTSALDNNVECLRELYNLNIPTMIVDNQKFYDKNKDKPKKDFYKLINVYAVSNITAIFKPDTKAISTAGNLDKKDSSKLFEDSGCIMIAKKKFSEKELINRGIEQILLSAIDNNIYASINKDKVIGKMGFIYELPSKYSSTVNYDKIIDEFGTPVDLFEGFRELDESETEFRVIVVFSGLSFPKTRIQEYAELVKENLSNRSNNEKEDIFSDIDKDKKLLNKARQSLHQVNTDEDEDTDDLDLSSLFSNYD